MFRGLSLVGFYRFDGAEEVSQKQRILQMLEEAGSNGVTGNQFYAACLPRFAARIKELRDQGYSITTRRIDGNHFVYTLRSGESEGRSANCGPRKTGTVEKCLPSDGAVTHSSVTGRDMEPGFSPPEGAPDQAQQDTEPVGRVSSALPTDPLPAFDGSQVEHESASVAVKCGSYYAAEAELEWEAA